MLAATPSSEVREGQFDNVEDDAFPSMLDAAKLDLGLQEAIIQQCNDAKAVENRSVISVKTITSKNFKINIFGFVYCYCIHFYFQGRGEKD